MERKWTPAQQDAIDIRGKTILVSAAAGSGKTATLTERIIRRITDPDSPADISEMLIVTFTRSAAAELKTRIFTALSDAVAENPTDRHLTAQLMKIGSAQISTIDSFYYDLIKANASSLGLSSSIRIADDAEYSLLAHSVMENVIDSFYESDENFASFAECFASIRRLNELSDVFLDIHEKLLSVPEGIEFLKKCSETTWAERDLDFFATSYGSILQKNTKETVLHYHSVICSALDFCNTDEKANTSYGPSFAYDLDFCNALLEALNNNEHGYFNVQTLLSTFSPIALKSLGKGNTTELSAFFKEERTKYIKKFRELSNGAFSKSPQTISRAMIDTSRYTYSLYLILSEFEKEIGKEKARIGILTFADVKRLALSLLVNPDGSKTSVAIQYAERYTDIYIDEYQDVDGVQDLIFSSISRSNNRFMVGDIKQSIYEFRGAQPQLFAKYRTEFPLYSSPEGEYSEQVSLFMSNNFRCDKNIIDFTNLVCSCIFAIAGDSIGYTKNDDLVYSKLVKDNGYISPKVKIAVVKSPSLSERKSGDFDEIASRQELEAEYVANEIERLIKYEKKADGTPIRAGDIAVLFKTKTISPLIAEALHKRGILSSEADSSKYFENPDVLMLLSLLNTVNNPENDTYLAGTLRSPIFNFDMEELITLRLYGDRSLSLFGSLSNYASEQVTPLAQKCKDFIYTLECWQADATALPVDGFLRMLFDSKAFIATGIVSQPNDDGDGGNILILYEYARTFEKGGFKGLYQFIEYINSMIEHGKTFSNSEIGISPDRVSLMTIHKSKGLEFPVCFVCDTTHSLRALELSESFVLDYPNGVALKISSADGMALMNTPMRDAICARIARKAAEENMRTLYVALTRARERLYITASSQTEPEALLEAASKKNIYFDRYSIINSSPSYLNWILTCCSSQISDCFDLEFIPLNNAKSSSDTEETSPLLEDKKLYEPDPVLTAKLRERLAFKYPYEELSKVPSKISVSRLYPGILDENDSSLELFTEPKCANIPDFFLKCTQPKTTSSQKGTATHLFLQFCNFERALKNGINEELALLEEKKFIPPETSRLVYTDELEKFLQSTLIKRIFAAEKIIREQRFNVELPPSGFTNDPELLAKMHGEVLAVQGVIDLILVNSDGSIELYDYKTDRLKADELSDISTAIKRMNRDHGLQLSYYAKAVNFLFGKPCSRVAVYSTHSAQLYDIDVMT